LVRNAKGQLEERVWKQGGMYGAAIDQVIYWLEKAEMVAENEEQAKALSLLIEYYKTGDLKLWDEYNMVWTRATEGDIDYINSFIEVYNDPLGKKASYESIVQIKDFEASARMKVVADNVQWFEDQSPILPEHKKANVVGVTYKMVNVAGESGDASPSTPIGVNLPNADWIRAEHGSKSVSLANIEGAYEKAAGKGLLEEFVFSEEERMRAEQHGELGSKLHTALHEVVGHASGKLNPGVGTPKETLKNYASTLEEARADLVALYFIMDPKMIEIGLMTDDGPAKAEYDNYIRNGMMLQLRRLNPGEMIEEDHMRNRQLVAAWAYEKGRSAGVIEKKVVDGKTYFVVNDYQALRRLFGELLREIQRIKSTGDFEAGKALVETYGVKVDAQLHQEVLNRSKKLNIAPYAGFINPRLVPIEQNGKIVDVKVEYPDDFTQQMLEYAKKYSFLPNEN
jgi:dipeptidyl-peptidase-3